MEGMCNRLAAANTGAHLGDALLDLDAQHDGVLLIENAGGHDLQDAREDSLQLGRLLLRLLGLQKIVSQHDSQGPAGQASICDRTRQGGT